MGLNFVLLGVLLLSVYQLIPPTSQQNIAVRNLEDSPVSIYQEACKDMEDVLFNMDKSKAEFAKKYRTDVRKSWRSENRLKKLATGEDLDAMEELMSLVPIIAPYALFAVISLFGYFCYYYCACCPDSICPPCKCCMNQNGKCCGIQCDKREPYKGLELMVPAVGMFITFLYLAIVCIIGLTHTNGIEEGFNAMKCAIVDAMYSMNYGGENWMGIQGFADNLGNFADNMRSDYKPKVQATFSQDSTWILNDEQAMNDNVDTMELDYDNIKPPTNNYIEETTLNERDFKYTVNPTTTINTKQPSCFFNTEAVLPECDYTNKSPIKWEGLVQAMRDVVTGAISASIKASEDVEQQGDSILLEIDAIADDVESGRDSIIDIRDSIDDSIKNINDSFNDASVYLNDYLTPNLNIIFGVFLAISILLGVIGALMVAFKYYKLRHFLHICWAFFAFLAFFLFILCVVFLLISVAGAEICDFVHQALNDPKLFDEFNIGNDIKEKMIICRAELGGDGDILPSFGVEDSLNKINSLDEKMEEQEIVIDASKDDLASLTQQLDQLLDYLDQLRDTAAVNGVLDNVDITIAQNEIEAELVNAGCAAHVVDDVWTNDQACAGQQMFSNMEYIFPATDTEKDLSNAGFTPGTVGDDYCIWWNGHYVTDAQLATYPPLTRDHFPKIGMKLQGSDTQTTGGNSRYQGGCGTAQAKVAALLKWRDDKNQVTVYKKQQAVVFLNSFETYQANQNAYSSRLKNFREDTNSLTGQITDKENGLLAKDKTNCKFAGEKLGLVYDGVCSVFFPNWYKFFQILASFTFGLLFSSFFMCCTAMRFSKNSNFLIIKNKVIPNESNDKAMMAAGAAGGVALVAPVMMNPDGNPMMQEIMGPDGVQRLNPDGSAMIAMVDMEGNPVLDQDGYPVNPQGYGHTQNKDVSEMIPNETSQQPMMNYENEKSFVNTEQNQIIIEREEVIIEKEENMIVEQEVEEQQQNQSQQQSANEFEEVKWD